ncbi:MAG: M18 family aminopeptidase [Clostridia bacterium]|nr:M18 family aminopeptidase [Clostridia bacterium]MBR6688089.1 M18 family aminopeptidase [Clostridia bacterium]
MNIQEFLATSYTPFHAVENCKRILQENGFVAFDDSVKAEKGGAYYLENAGSSIVAFKVGDLSNYAFNIVASHTDSPMLKVKGSKLIKSPQGYRINAEVYGGLLRYSMLDIPLKIVGRLFIKDGNAVKPVLYESPFNVNIPSMCIHHQPDVNEKFALNPQVDMLPLIGGEEQDLYKVICADNRVIDADLYVAPAVAPSLTGANGQFLVSPRIDNLTSVYTSIMALVESTPKSVAIAACFDNEEIGSHTKQGAYSDLLPTLLKRINKDLKKTDASYQKALRSGMLLSCDNAHGVHPAHPEKSDPEQKVILNGGIVIKHHTNYTTDGLSSALLKTLLDDNNVKYQDYYNRSDIRCGGTLGLITSAMLNLNAVDIGLGQLAMHSAVETVGYEDIEKMQKCINCFYNCKITHSEKGIVIK